MAHVASGTSPTISMILIFSYEHHNIRREPKIHNNCRNGRQLRGFASLPRNPKRRSSCRPSSHVVRCWRPVHRCWRSARYRTPVRRHGPNCVSALRSLNRICAPMHTSRLPLRSRTATTSSPIGETRCSSRAPNSSPCSGATSKWSISRPRTYRSRFPRGR